jgi:tripartite ATP-independent transporter DctM subunit
MAAVAIGLALVIFMAGGVWIAISLFATALIAIHFFLDAPAGLVLATSAWGFIDNWTLTALPLFILMGELLFRTNLADHIFRSLVPWTSSVPGGLLHANVLGCGLFAAVCGSSTATTVTVGKITYPELTRRGYDEGMIVGTLAGSGTFGLLIPPSTMMIIYGFIAETSIIKLFVAGILPGLLLMGLFSLYIIGWALLNPGKAPPAEPRVGWWERIVLGRYLFPVVALIVGLMVVMYFGIATATEAAAVGVLFALGLLIATRTFTWDRFLAAMLSSTRTSCMIMFILLGAAYFTQAMGFSGIPDALGAWVAGQKLSPVALIAALTVLYILLGMLLDGVSMVVLTASTVLPMIQAAGIDKIWFGVFIVLVVEMSLITPPVGLNLFVMRAFSTKVSDTYIFRCALPFFFLMVIAVAIIVAFPQIAMFLPGRM